MLGSWLPIDFVRLHKELEYYVTYISTICMFKYISDGFVIIFNFQRNISKFIQKKFVVPVDKFLIN